MKDIDEILTLIEDLRSKLALILEQKDNLNDPEIIAISMELDDALNEYYKMLKS